MKQILHSPAVRYLGVVLFACVLFGVANSDWTGHGVGTATGTAGVALIVWVILRAWVQFEREHSNKSRGYTSYYYKSPDLDDPGF